MYVCICNALTDTDVKRAADSAGARRPAEVFAACRCRAQCGSCIRSVCGLLGLSLRGVDAADSPDHTMARSAAAA